MHPDTRIFKLTLIRHGETRHNRMGLVQGQLDIPMSELGRVQVRSLAKFLYKAGVTFDQAYTSDLNRAQETCEMLYPSRHRIKPNRLLRERACGSLEGLPFQVARALIKRNKNLHEATRSQSSYEDSSINRQDVNKGESERDFRFRVEQFCEQVLFPSVKHKEHVLVVSHGGTIREFMKYFNDRYQAQIKPETLNLVTPNTAINDFDILLTSTSSGTHRLVVPVNTHNIFHMTFDVFNRDKPPPTLDTHMTTLEQFQAHAQSSSVTSSSASSVATSETSTSKQSDELQQQ